MPGHESVGAIGLTVHLPKEIVEAVAERVAQLLASRTPTPRSEPWIGVEEAAAYLCCPKSRIYDLVAQRRVRVYRDGRRLLFRASWLDACLEERVSSQ